MEGEKRRVNIILILLMLIVIQVWSFRGVEFELDKLMKIKNTVHFISGKWFPPDWSVLSKVWKEALITLQIALVGTSLSLFIALPLSFLAASNTTPFKGVYQITRGFLSFLRSVPEIVFALVLIPTVGLGPFGGTLALVLHNIGVLGKLISERIEASQLGPQEAIMSVGGTKFAVITFGIIPQIMPNILSDAFYRLEVNIRASLILGIIGAGGIGQLLFIHFKIFEYQKVTVDTLIILLMVIGVDYLGSKIRKKVI